MHSDWQCERDGVVLPLHLAPQASFETTALLASKAEVPLWAPEPMLPGWCVTGLAHAGDERTGARATVLACSGPSPVRGPADLVLVAEEPGTGLGARYAGLPSGEPDVDLRSAPHAKVLAAGHPTGLWPVATGEDRVAFVGEARGVWLWAVLWPASADLVLLEHISLADLREPGLHHQLVFGAPSPHLRPVA